MVFKLADGGSERACHYRRRRRHRIGRRSLPILIPNASRETVFVLDLCSHSLPPSMIEANKGGETTTSRLAVAECLSSFNRTTMFFSLRRIAFLLLLLLRVIKPLWSLQQAEVGGRGRRRSSVCGGQPNYVNTSVENRLAC